MMCDKVVWDKAVCERWCVTKLCVKDGLWQGCVWKMVGERGCVTKWCVKDGASQSSVWKMVCDKVVCDKAVCVKDGGWKIVCHSTLYTPRSTLHTPYSTLHTLHFPLHTPHSTLYTWHSRLYTLHSTLHTLHSTLHTLHFTLRTPPTTVYTLHCPPPTVMILSPLVNRLLEAQTICSTFGRLLLALQPFAPPSSVSLLIPLQTILFRTPTDAALRWASEFLHFPPFPPALGDFPSFSVVFFLPFSCHSSIFLHFPPVFNDFPSFSLVFSSLFPAGVNGPRGNRSLPSPLCVVVHAPQKSSIYPPSTAPNFEILVPYATTTPQTP